jgi:hypothetical protein
VRLAGIEPATLGLEVRCSIQLSYRRGRHLHYTRRRQGGGVRSAPDSSVNNNWSTYPNVNPYTGQQGTQQPKVLDG